MKSSDIEKYPDLIETTISSKSMFKGRVFETLVKDVKLADGSTSKREIILHHGGACILPVDEEFNCYMVRQFRSPFEEVLLETPAGKLEIDENPKACAIRELLEETGFVAENVYELGQMIATPGYDSEIIWMYAATGLRYEGERPDDGEFLKCEKIPLGELLKMADNGEIRDGKTQLTIYKAARRLGFEQ